MYYRYRLHKKQKKEVKLLKKWHCVALLMVLRWFAENTKKFKKIVKLDILSSVISLFVSVKNLNYVLSCKTNEDFLCNGAWVLPQINKKKGQICPLFILV